MYARECTRRSSGTAQVVPKLKEAYTLCDSWTKFNMARELVYIWLNTMNVNCMHACTYNVLHIIIMSGLARLIISTSA